MISQSDPFWTCATLTQSLLAAILLESLMIRRWTAHTGLNSTMYRFGITTDLSARSITFEVAASSTWPLLLDEANDLLTHAIKSRATPTELLIVAMSVIRPQLNKKHSGVSAFGGCGASVYLCADASYLY